MNPREAISAQSAEQRKNTRRLPMELLLFLICSFVCIAVFGCGEDIKGIQTFQRTEVKHYPDEYIRRKRRGTVYFQCEKTSCGRTGCEKYHCMERDLYLS